MSKKNKNDRDQSWRKELGLDDGLDESIKKTKPKKEYTGNWRQDLGLEEAPQKKSKLIKCTSCKKRISVLAETCPGCGAPNESKEIVAKNSNAAVWSILSVLFILFLMFHCELGIPLGWFGECTYTKPFWE
jgi:hypothetical protein